MSNWENPEQLFTGRNISIVVIALCILFLAFGGFYTVAEGSRGVIVTNGKLTGIAQPGLGFKVPIIDKVIEISVQDHVAMYEKMESYSRDQQPAVMTVSVSYRLAADKVGEIYQVYGGQQGVIDRLLTRKVLEETKTVFGTFNAESAIRERGRLNLQIRQAIEKSIDGPLVIAGVQVEDIAFSGAYEQSVEQRMLAEVGVQKEKQNLEREKVAADIVRAQAAGEADKVRFAANAEADAIRAKGNAEAEAINARAEALKNNAALIDLVQAERWDGKLPATMIPGGSVPFVNVK